MSNVIQFPKSPVDYLAIDGGMINAREDWFWVYRVLDGASCIVWSGRHYADALACAREMAREERLRIVDMIAPDNNGGAA